MEARDKSYKATQSASHLAVHLSINEKMEVQMDSKSLF